MALRRRLLRLSAAAAGGLRRSLTTAPSHPPWAMMGRAPQVVGARSVDVRLAEPPQVSAIRVPEHLIDTKGSTYPSSAVPLSVGGGLTAASGDGLLYLAYLDLPCTPPTAAADLPSVTRFVCNPVTRELSRLPASICSRMGDILCSRNMGLLTQADRGHGPPDRFALAVLQGNTMIRFLSETEEWGIVEASPCRRLPLSRRMEIHQEPLAFRGRLWWVDLTVTGGAISADPLSDRPELSFVRLPGRSTQQDDEAPPSMYRRVGVSQGRLRYVEVSQEEPFLLSSFVLNDDAGDWTLEHRVVLDKIWGSSMSIPLQMKGTTSVVLIHPLNANVVYLMVMGPQIVAVDMETEEVLETCIPDSADSSCIPCVLPSWLGSSRIPSKGKKDVEKNKTLADVLVRSDGNYKR